MKNQNQNENQNTNEPNQTNETNYDHGQIGCKHRLPTARLVLPFMKNAEDAMQLCRLEQDTFYLSAFTIQLWLGEAITSTTAEYAEKKDPRTRSLQSGQTWRVFLHTTAHQFVRQNARKPRYGKPIKPETLDKIYLTDLVSDIIRLAQYDDPFADLVREALMRYLIENPLNTETAIDDPTSCINDPAACLVRICDWLDSVLHWREHWGWHKFPDAYDPDPEKRELFMLGQLQRNLDAATDVEKAHWQWHFGDAVTQYADSPKFNAVADGFKSSNTRVWNYRDVDRAIITLWPLVKRHNWTYADLLKVIRPFVKRPKFYPCHREQTFATYCNNVLGLKKTGKGTSSNGNPAGIEIAKRLLGVSA